MHIFGDINEPYNLERHAQIILQGIPYDGTSTWGKGADKGFEAFIEASHNLELYDIETDSEVYRHGIYAPSVLEDFESPEIMFDRVYRHTQSLLKKDKFLTFFGGEHSISIGIMKAFAEEYQDLTVLHIDAHADLRSSYLGSPYNHACAMHEANKTCNLIQVGIRSMDVTEKEFMNHEKVFFAHYIRSEKNWLRQVVEKLTDKVYISFDLDALDPSIMPATGTPEPGGLWWHETLELLRLVFKTKDVVGFDIVELTPIESLRHPQFLAAKLYYKMLSYKFE